MIKCPCVCGKFKAPALTVDGIVLKENEIVLIKRKKEPYKGSWALPGGFVECGESVEKAVLREVKEETGLDCKIDMLFGVYSDPKRDPRGHMVSIVYVLEPITQEFLPTTDASEAKWFNIEDLPELAFDHGKIVEDFKVFRWNSANNAEH
ncbi:MAG: NUDIX domain-containing protein [Candidatus Hydrothermarchaeota archaeon]